MSWDLGEIVKQPGISDGASLWAAGGANESENAEEGFPKEDILAGLIQEAKRSPWASIT